MDRISTFNQQRQFITQALEVQRRYAVEQTQLATSVKSLTYDGYGADARTIISLEAEMKAADQYASNGTLVAARVEASYGATTSLLDLAGNARSWLSSVISGATDDVSGVNTQAQAYLAEVAGLLNTKVDGYYVFAGTLATEAPVDISAYAATDPAAADTSYYRGGGGQASYEAAPGQTIVYGARADAGGFEKLMRALSVVSGADENPADIDLLEEAFGLLDEAIDEMSVEQARIAGIASSVDGALDRNLDFQLYVDALVEDLKNVDVAEITARLSATELQLESAFSTLQKLQSINLLDYL